MNKNSKETRVDRRLEKAEKNYESVSGRHKQTNLHFERKQDDSGKYHTDIGFKREAKTNFSKERGLLHKAEKLKDRVTGDVPSVTKFIDSKNPKTIKGKVLKKTAQGINFAVHDVAKTANDTALASETALLKTKDFAQREARNKLKQKYHREAVDDYHKGAFIVAGTAVDAVKGTRNYFKQKKRNTLEKAKYKLKKAEYKYFKENTYKPALKKTMADIKGEKAESDFKKKKAVIRRKYKLRELKNQKSIMLKSSPGILFLKPFSYSSKKMQSSAWQKAVNENDDNDMLQAVDSAKRRIAEPVADRFSKANRLHKKEKQRDKLQEQKT